MNRNEPVFADPKPDDDWHGWGFPNGALHIGHLPARKSVALYAMDGSRMWVLAYFRDETEARRAMAIIDALVWPHTFPGYRES